MSWKDDPKIRDLEPYARKHGYQMIVLFAVSENGEQYAITTYGRTKRLCDSAKAAGGQLEELVQSEKWPDWDKEPKQ